MNEEVFDVLNTYSKLLGMVGIKHFILNDLFISFYNNELARNINIGFSRDKKTLIKYRYEYNLDHTVYLSMAEDRYCSRMSKTVFLESLNSFFSDKRITELELLLDEAMIELV
jgi:hypothetical protein